MGKPVIAYKTGGIPLQIEHGVTGFLIDTGDTEQITKYLYMLLTNKKKYARMSANARERVRDDFFTLANATRWLYLGCFALVILHQQVPWLELLPTL